jgi:hypothetical protein
MSEEDSQELLRAMLDEIMGPSLDVSKLIRDTRREWSKDVIRRKLREAAIRRSLRDYVRHRGRAQCNPPLRSVTDVVVAQRLVHSSQPYALRWAMCRIVLGLRAQPWWLDTPLTDPLRDTIISDTHAAGDRLRRMHGTDAVDIHRLLAQLWLKGSSPSADRSTCVQVYCSMAWIHSARALRRNA